MESYYQQYFTGCSLNIVFFSKNFRKFAPLPRQHSAAIGCAQNYQPMEATVHSHSVERSLTAM